MNMRRRAFDVLRKLDARRLVNMRISSHNSSEKFNLLCALLDLQVAPPPKLANIRSSSHNVLEKLGLLYALL